MDQKTLADIFPVEKNRISNPLVDEISARKLKTEATTPAHRRRSGAAKFGTCFFYEKELNKPPKDELLVAGPNPLSYRYHFFINRLIFLFLFFVYGQFTKIFMSQPTSLSAWCRASQQVYFIFYKTSLSA
jgi:hypothetical protein